MANHSAPIQLASVRERVARRRASEAQPQPREQSGGRAWINGREVAPKPSLAHLSLSYD